MDGLVRCCVIVSDDAHVRFRIEVTLGVLSKETQIGLNLIPHSPGTRIVLRHAVLQALVKRQIQVSIKRAFLSHCQSVGLRVRAVTLMLRSVGQFPGEAVQWSLRWTERPLQSDER